MLSTNGWVFGSRLKGSQMKTAVWKASHVLCALAASALLFAASGAVRAAPPLPPLSGDTDHLTALRLAGIAGDRSQIPALIAALNTPSDSVETTALLALAQIGATEALPVFGRIIRQPPNPWTGNYARAARARLIAEAVARRQAPAETRLQSKIAVFLALMKLRPAQITATLAVQQHQIPRPAADTLPVRACEEIADMIYRSRRPYTRPLHGLHGLDFGLVPGARLKIQLAQLPMGQRLAWMIARIAESSISGRTELRLIQLAADEGRPASRAAAAKLKEIRAHRSRYPTSGFAGLFDVIRSAGDPTQAALVRSFTHDQNRWVAFVVQDSLPSIERGQREQVLTGY